MWVLILCALIVPSLTCICSMVLEATLTPALLCYLIALFMHVSSVIQYYPKGPIRVKSTEVNWDLLKPPSRLTENWGGKARGLFYKCGKGWREGQGLGKGRGWGGRRWTRERGEGRGWEEEEDGTDDNDGGGTWWWGRGEDRGDGGWKEVGGGGKRGWWGGMWGRGGGKRGCEEERDGEQGDAEADKEEDEEEAKLGVLHQQEWQL